ncbi:MAG: hypothetical protein ACOCV8_03305, partial [Spirochaetota bacterium]
FVQINNDLIEVSEYNDIDSIKQFEDLLHKLYLIGLLEKYPMLNPTGYKATNLLNTLLLKQLNKLYHNTTEEEHSKSIIVNRDFSILIQSDIISDTDRYIIFAFTEKLTSSEEVISRRITRKSIQEAVYLGHSLDTFISLIKNKSQRKADEQIINYCKEWEQNLKKVVVKKVYIIEGDSGIIDTIELDPEINIGKMKKIGNNHIIVENPEQIPHNIGLDNIYVYKEEEDF